MKGFVEFITHPAFLWTAGAILASGLVMWLVSYLVASHLVYKNTLRRTSKEQWGRDLPSDLGENTVKMYEEGLAWAKSHADKKIDVHVVRDGLNLYGEYYDFGSDTCAFILSGRTEALKYGYYFAIPYAECGCNILVVDPRAHGLSDGEFNTTGFEESQDDIAWVDLLEERFGIKRVIFHGICIGSAGGVYALTAENAPKNVIGIVAEGMYVNFYESVKHHLIERKKPVFVMMDLINARMKHYTGYSMKVGPIDCIDRLDRPLLMLHSKKDQYSKAEAAVELFEKAGSADKTIVWFEEGDHSMLRITDTARYDGAIKSFVEKLNAKGG